MSTSSKPTIALTLGAVIVYVDEPVKAAELYTRAFGLSERFRGPGGAYVELDAGTSRIGFVTFSVGQDNVQGGVRRPGEQPANIELALVSEDIDAAFAQACGAGCVALAEPVDKPWGQRVAYVRDPFGTLIELASPW